MHLYRGNDSHSSDRLPDWKVLCLNRVYYEQFQTAGESIVTQNQHFDVIIAGGGLAGITAALELLDHDLNIAIIDRDTAANLGGLATKSLGGMALVNTPIQRFNGIRDTPEIALRDWHSFAQFSEQDNWPRNLGSNRR